MLDVHVAVSGLRPLLGNEVLEYNALNAATVQQFCKKLPQLNSRFSFKMAMTYYVCQVNSSGVLYSISSSGQGLVKRNMEPRRLPAHESARAHERTARDEVMRFQTAASTR